MTAGQHPRLAFLPCPAQSDVLDQVREGGIRADRSPKKFSDLHSSAALPLPDLLDAPSFDGGIAFDGSSIRGLKSIHESDMAMGRNQRPAGSSLLRHRTLSLICSIQDRAPATLWALPRSIARRPWLPGCNRLADRPCFGPRAGILLVSTNVLTTPAPVLLLSVGNSIEAAGTQATRGSGNLAQNPQQGGVFPPSWSQLARPPTTLPDIRSEMLLIMARWGCRRKAPPMWWRRRPAGTGFASPS